MEGDYVVSWFRENENDLHGFIKTVPYCDEHKNVWSPVLVKILLETCSILDSTWKFRALQSPCVKQKDLGIKKYFQYFGEELGPRWVVFRTQQAIQIKPFDVWDKSSYKESDYTDLEWWKVHNELKHDRIKNIKKATLFLAVNALAGLFLAIVKSDFCREALVHEGWIAGTEVGNIDENFSNAHLSHALVESRLFTYPVGWWNQNISKSHTWQHPGSSRFIKWVDEFETPEQ